jgi:large subunit ribosomal protein L24
MALRRLRKDDTVLVIAGRERGKTGKVLRLLPEKDRVLVERVNLVKRHVKPRGVQQPGGIQEKEAALHASSVVPLCPRCNKPTRIGSRRLKDGHAQRVCRRCGEPFESA